MAHQGQYIHYLKVLTQSNFVAVTQFYQQNVIFICKTAKYRFSATLRGHVGGKVRDASLVRWKARS